MNEEVENMVRRALEDEAESYHPSDWAHGAEGVRERVAGRRRRLRNTVAVSLAVAGTAAAAVLGVVLTQAPRSAAVGPAAGSGAASPTHRASAAASSSASAVASASAWASAHAIAWPTVQIVRPGQTMVYAHQIWLRLTSSERCEGMGLPDGGYSCKSVTDGNQAPDSVSLQSGGDTEGQEFSPLYIGSGDVARMSITYRGVTYPVQVVKLAGHPGYATGYLWLPNMPTPTPTATRSSGFPFMFDEASITVYDVNGKVLATMAPPTFHPPVPSNTPSASAH